MQAKVAVEHFIVEPAEPAVVGRSTIQPAKPSFQTPRPYAFEGIVSECPRMQRVLATIDKVAQSNSTVLVLGESGTGKELVARALHARSRRKGKLVPVNCGAIPEEILESELFGHERGAFTGAVNSRIGRFQLADGGTIFLDEIGEMSPKLQVKLLRVLQERKIDPVGSVRSLDVDVRVVAATNKDLRVEVQKGRFREDLYYRLQVIPIELPPLRARGNDMEVLARWFLQQRCGQSGIPLLHLEPRVIEVFRRYGWPGNIRELENLIERLVVLAEQDRITVNDLPDYLLEGLEHLVARTSDANEVPEGRSANPHSLESVSLTSAISRETVILECLPEGGIDFNELVNSFENRLILLALERTGWNKKAAAELLRLNRTTLVEKIRKKGLELGEGDNELGEIQ